MGLYDALKDAVSLAQKADNIELYRQLLDLSAQALDLQAEVAKLREENAKLKKAKDLESEIEYHVDSFITKRSDTKPIKYCAACWAGKKVLVPIQFNDRGSYRCPLCNVRIYNRNERIGYLE